MILILIFIIILYLTDKKFYALIGFFFFLTDGFQLLPEEFFWIAGKEIKSQDYALVFLIAGLFSTILLRKDLKLNYFPFGLKIFSLFFLLTIAISLLHYHIPYIETIKSTRLFLLFLSPILFFDLSYEDINRLKKNLFIITLFLSAVYIFQPLSGIKLLNGYAGMGKMEIAGFTIKRFYNLPFFIYYFVFYSIFSSPFKGIKKYLSILLIITPCVLSMHRSLILGITMTVLLSLLIQKASLNVKAKALIMVMLFAMPFTSIIWERFEKGGTFKEMTQILNGDVSSLDYEDELENKTLLFRFGHFYERASHVSKSTISILFGSGWMSEGSPYTQSNFDFIIGLPDKETDEIIQIDTSDITWSQTIVRLGYLGTLIYCFFIVSLLLFFYRKRENTIAMISFSSIMLFAITSFTSVLLFSPLMFILPLIDYFCLSEVYEFDKKELCLSRS
ncbi:MAG: hypothetical protein Q4F97_12150 [Bacteroidales bacterium]|nr:hypothetical protein [Bacteroidales bacterium]